MYYRMENEPFWAICQGFEKQWSGSGTASKWKVGSGPASGSGSASASKWHAGSGFASGSASTWCGSSKLLLTNWKTSTEEPDPEIILFFTKIYPDPSRFCFLDTRWVPVRNLRETHFNDNKRDHFWNFVYIAHLCIGTHVLAWRALMFSI
jgi:hypothetical protein